MAVSYQLVIDCTSPELLAHFWAEALHHVITLPPSGFDSWDDFYRSIGVSEVELGTGPDRIEDPNGEGPRIWFQIVPEKKSIKNRLHIDENASAGRDAPLNTRHERVEAQAARLVSPGATRPQTTVEESLDRYPVALSDPRETSSTSTSRC